MAVFEKQEVRIITDVANGQYVRAYVIDTRKKSRIFAYVPVQLGVKDHYVCRAMVAPRTAGHYRMPTYVQLDILEDGYTFRHKGSGRRINTNYMGAKLLKENTYGDLGVDSNMEYSSIVEDARGKRKLFLLVTMNVTPSLATGIRRTLLDSMEEFEASPQYGGNYVSALSRSFKNKVVFMFEDFSTLHDCVAEAVDSLDSSDDEVKSEAEDLLEAVTDAMYDMTPNESNLLESWLKPNVSISMGMSVQMEIHTCALPMNLLEEIPFEEYRNYIVLSSSNYISSMARRAHATRTTKKDLTHYSASMPLTVRHLISKTYAEASIKGE